MPNLYFRVDKRGKRAHALAAFAGKQGDLAHFTAAFWAQARGFGIKADKIRVFY
jgi:hypothetical protein